jgi:hypothetical protein
MSDLKHTARAFFTLWTIRYVIILALYGFFRAIRFLFSSYEGASQIPGLAITLLIIHTGYAFGLSATSTWTLPFS